MDTRERLGTQCVLEPASPPRARFPLVIGKRFHLLASVPDDVVDPRVIAARSGGVGQDGWVVSEPHDAFGLRGAPLCLSLLDHRCQGADGGSDSVSRGCPPSARRARLGAPQRCPTVPLRCALNGSVEPDLRGHRSQPFGHHGTLLCLFADPPPGTPKGPTGVRVSQPGPDPGSRWCQPSARASLPSPFRACFRAPRFPSPKPNTAGWMRVGPSRWARMPDGLPPIGALFGLRGALVWLRGFVLRSLSCESTTYSSARLALPRWSVRVHVEPCSCRSSVR